MSTCPEGYVQCPYDPVHIILQARLQFHLVKCKQVHKQSRLVECPFNSTHKIPDIELNCHIRYLCPDRKKIHTFICSTESTTSLFPVQQYEAPTSENWDDVQQDTYNPIDNCQNKAVLLNLPGAKPSDRKHFRAEERQRYRNVVQKGCAKGPTRMPKSKAKTDLQHNDRANDDA